MKLADMGTTGLIDYIQNHRPGRSMSMAYTNALKVIRKRYGTQGVIRFKQAEQATWLHRRRNNIPMGWERAAAS
jgi:hypothetical protein